MAKKAPKLSKNHDLQETDGICKKRRQSQNKDQYKKGHSAVQRVAIYLMQKYAVYWPKGGASSQYSAFIGQKM